jgi:hypothetical protein
MFKFGALMSDTASDEGQRSLFAFSFQTHQKVRPAWPALLKARASVEMALPMALHSEALKEAAVPMTCGNDVADGVGAAKTTPAEVATPCSASFHLRSGYNGKRA